jgi:dihydroxyacid dehydratase/phosphogluconate dehydratase
LHRTNLPGGFGVAERSGKHFLADFDEAGGIPSVMKELLPLLATDEMTVTGASLGENLKFAPAGVPTVIYPLILKWPTPLIRVRP